MSVLITSVLVGCGILVGRLIARGSSSDKDAKPAQVPAPEETNDDVKPKAPAAPNLDAFPCKLGDVVLRSTGEEAWLAGALVLREGDEPAAVLYWAPEAGGDRVVLARPASQEIIWLAEEKGVTVVGEPPTALEAGTDRYERRRRLPLRAERVGTGAPDLGKDVILAEYTGLGDDCLVVLATKERVVAFRGPSLGAGAYDVLPGKNIAES